MRIACLQFNPKLGQVASNISHADNLLAQVDLEKLDLLVLPELAFTGYNYSSLSSILPYLEPTASGASTKWAFSTASRLNCIVSVGYPEKTSTHVSISSRSALNPSSTANYNSTITVSPDRQILAHYRKTHLYYTDETWAHESDTGWLTTNLPLAFHSNTGEKYKPLASTSTPNGPVSAVQNGLPTAFGICMDLNPHLFTAPWTAYEFASHALRTNAHLVVLSTAWTLAAPTSISSSSSLPTSQTHTSTPTQDSPSPLSIPPEDPQTPSHKTLTYWLMRLTPLLSSSSSLDSSSPAERIVVIANRCGKERDVTYAGTSTVMALEGGTVRVWGSMGEGEEGVLVVDTEEREEWRGKLTGDKE
ncbi:Carbon-nitrogen hydrolase [Varicellaria rhodocarpa]|nr:Carbon-nitrogen hydrolase [Varicellaria rhodocarpa]